MQKNADKENPQGDQQQDDQMQELGQQDLDQMMKDLEDPARRAIAPQALAQDPSDGTMDCHTLRVAGA